MVSHALIVQQLRNLYTYLLEIGSNYKIILLAPSHRNVCVKRWLLGLGLVQTAINLI